MRVSWLSTPLLDDTIIACGFTVCQLCFRVCWVTRQYRCFNTLSCSGGKHGTRTRNPLTRHRCSKAAANHSLTFRGHDRT